MCPIVEKLYKLATLADYSINRPQSLLRTTRENPLSRSLDPIPEARSRKKHRKNELQVDLRRRHCRLPRASLPW